MLRLLRHGIAAFAVILSAQAACAQGTIPLAMIQQIDVNGQPLAGCQVFFFQAGTVATPQNAYADFGLTQALPNPLTCDQTGRVPMFWLADGLIHVRLTDSSGNVQIDTTMQVLGPSSGSSGGGPTVDPTTIAATGDIKFRLTSETLSGWVFLNGQTIGSATSGATGRANADTQNLFVYLWTNCSNAHCPVVGGRGSSAIADFQANKQITLLDLRDRMPVGRDCMGNTCAGGLLASNISSGGGDGIDTPAATGGAANISIAQTNLPNVNFNVTITAGQWLHSHGFSFPYGAGTGPGPGGAGPNANNFTGNTSTVSNPQLTGSAPSGGIGAPFAVMSPFALGSWYIKL